MPLQARPRVFRAVSPDTPVTRRVLRSVSPRTPRAASPRIGSRSVSPRTPRPESPHAPAPLQVRLYDGSSDNINPLQNIRWISEQLDRLNEDIPHLSNRLVTIIRDIQGVRVREPVPAQTAAANLRAMCKILRAFLNYYNHDETSPIHLAIQTNNLGNTQLRDTLMVINEGIKHYSDMNQYDSTRIIPELVARNQLPARTGGQKSKIRKHRKRAARRLTRKLIKKTRLNA